MQVYLISTILFVGRILTQLSVWYWEERMYVRQIGFTAEYLDDLVERVVEKGSIKAFFWFDVMVRKGIYY